ncbi:uncharacterized protein [Henckelia pumila]|uniref:uncharacterized protein n=1 Tax=Henckelia pumila TaxID=405737 RepID=UPI003C6E154F
MPPRSLPLRSGRTNLLSPPTEQVPPIEQVPPVVPNMPLVPTTEQGSTTVTPMDTTANPMEVLLKRFQSFKPPSLHGTEDYVACESWLDDIEQLFESIDYTDDRRVRLSYRKDKGAEFANLQQGSMCIEDYVANFSTLLRLAPHIADNEEAKADQFINGINPDVFTLVNVGRPNNLADALDKAKSTEAGGGSSSNKRDRFRPKGKQFKKQGSSFSSSGGSKPYGSSQGSGSIGWFCSKCGGRHSSDACKGVSGTCNLCNRPGHYARVCPTRGTSQGATQADRQAPAVQSFQSLENQAQEAPDNVIAGNCVLSGYPAYVLIDTGASHTFVAEKFVALHALPVENLSSVFAIPSPMGTDKTSARIFRGCELQFDSNAIELDCMTGAEGFLVYALDVLKASPELEDISVVCEFADIFPDEIPGLPPMREVDFSIELEFTANRATSLSISTIKLNLYFSDGVILFLFCASEIPGCFGCRVTGSHVGHGHEAVE